MNQPDISVIIVNYNTADLIGTCLDSVLRQQCVAIQIFVVDNASFDDGVAIVKKRYPRVSLIANETNLGFSAANNQVLPFCRGRYLFFLNPDTEVFDDAFRRTVDFMDQNPDIGICGIDIRNPDGTRQQSINMLYPGQRHGGVRFNGLPGEIAWVVGAGMVIRASLMRELGGFDERFFLYGEEVDLCLRIRQAGYLIGYCRDAGMLHWGGMSERREIPRSVWGKKFAAEIRFFQKHYPPRALKRIRNLNLVQAIWRLGTLYPLLPFTKNKPAAFRKIAKYRAMLQVYRNVDF
jgi:hypothetical protein